MLGKNKITCGLGPELVRKTTNMIQIVCDHLRVAQNHQKSYANRMRQSLEILVRDFVFLKVTPKRGVSRFVIKGKLAPRFTGSFEITERVGSLAYHLALPPQLSHIHKVFNVSILGKYKPDPSHVIT